MATEERDLLTRDLLQVLAKYGVSGLPTSAVAGGPRSVPSGVAASYIREIITGDVAFDPGILAQVARILQKGTGG